MMLIVGLGNPGQIHANNRHNLGFMCLHHFARTHGFHFDRKQGKARIALGKVDGINVVLARPQMYMNSSGQAVSLLVQGFDVSLDNLLIIHDDLDLPLGKIRIRKGGSPGGHNGIKSIIAELGSRDFLRLRVGIGRPNTTDSRETENDIINYVLSDFTSEEKQIIEPVIPRVNEAILCFLTEGLAAAMNKYNRDATQASQKT